ncbi:MAG: tRNA uridine-5-carboxymethylaminomethyl(34) synthesis GTPase MnmE, partial [Eubacterium sp.]|nr:tRNA uridine-5-carboxymethylaminomethyl(34) synthesis GTPase MnmE [Eubacterium sp.]
AMSNSGIGIVRISGDEALDVADRIFRPKKGSRKVSDMETHTIHYGYVTDGDEVIDEVMLLIMKAPRSYTCEDTIEIDCHGGVLVMKKILETVLKYGARPAEPGEFTKRAFLNGRIDLSQAESVIDVINAQNELALKSSVSQLQGAVLEKIKAIRAVVLHEIAFIESALDDPEHVSLEGYPEQLHEIMSDAHSKVKKLLDSSDNGKMLKEGINTAIVGKPNAGKSSLLNILVGEERAIVTEIAGTTRDILQEQIQIGGIGLNVIDTAGIRDTEDIVEKIGVNKSREYIEKADLIIYVVDSSTELDENDQEIIEAIRNKKAIVLLNKSDLDAKTDASVLQTQLSKPILSISAKNNTGIHELETLIEEMFFSGKLSFNDEVYITNIRQKNALAEAQNSLKMVLQSIADGMPEDFFTIDMMNAYEALGTIIGESVGEDLVNEIFSKFCMGK